MSKCEFAVSDEKNASNICFFAGQTLLIKIVFSMARYEFAKYNMFELITYQDF